ncbi:MmcQ/YjbR family DNA-binding protein [Bradyrhizobium sp. 138]|uniref:MmcQ/YjbR family DNA-binding protein n=1 Tax=Bradyrhizobium sp. 138 TaxID=2782615 RepID=UPI001FFBA0CD|nr:MmcQ/YjbR family DNA-binding protein [Bradyrhizobium sp. 138]MCK1733981.1 MmcQ/YjbR family DNA-binding protein [Bradyrhizobium sp. 138]
MSPKTFETRCLRLPAITKVVQWEGTSVFKVGGKMFALDGGFAARSGGYMFKVSNMAYAMLIEHGLARPAPYLARAKWVQLVSNSALSDAELASYLAQAHALIVAKLTRKARKELGLGAPEAERHDHPHVQRTDRSRRH